MGTARRYAEGSYYPQVTAINDLEREREIARRIDIDRTRRRPPDAGTAEFTNTDEGYPVMPKPIGQVCVDTSLVTRTTRRPVEEEYVLAYPN